MKKLAKINLAAAGRARGDGGVKIIGGKSCRILSVMSEIFTVYLFVRCIMLVQEQSGSGIFYLWYVIPLCLLLLSHGAYFTPKWLYTVPLVGLAFLVLWADERFDPALGVILLLMVLFYGLMCYAHQGAKSKQL